MRIGNTEMALNIRTDQAHPAASMNYLSRQMERLGGEVHRHSSTSIKTLSGSGRGIYFKLAGQADLAVDDDQSLYQFQGSVGVINRLRPRLCTHKEKDTKAYQLRENRRGHECRLTGSIASSNTIIRMKITGMQYSAW